MFLPLFLQINDFQIFVALKISPLIINEILLLSFNFKILKVLVEKLTNIFEKH